MGNKCQSGVKQKDHADHLIVQSTLDISFHNVVILVEDIIVLVLLLDSATDDREMFF